MKREFHYENGDGSCDGDSDGDYNYNFFMNMTVLQNIISEVGKCPLRLNQTDLKSKYGFSFKLILLCSNLDKFDCNWSTSYYTSLQVDSQNTPGREAYEINFRSVMAFQEIGKGYHSLCTFASNMNMISSMARRIYDSINEKLHVYETVAEQSTTNATKKKLQ